MSCDLPVYRKERPNCYDDSVIPYNYRNLGYKDSGLAGNCTLCDVENPKLFGREMLEEGREQSEVREQYTNPGKRMNQIEEYTNSGKTMNQIEGFRGGRRGGRRRHGGGRRRGYGGYGGYGYGYGYGYPYGYPYGYTRTPDVQVITTKSENGSDFTKWLPWMLVIAFVFSMRK